MSFFNHGARRKTRLKNSTVTYEFQINVVFTEIHISFIINNFLASAILVNLKRSSKFRGNTIPRKR